MNDKSYEGRTVLVVGAARSGIAASEFLLSRGARVILTDTKSEMTLSAQLTPLREQFEESGRLVLELGGHQVSSFRKSNFVVLSPGVPATLSYLEESRKAALPIMAEVELAYRHLKGKLLGITGSNGKTTTTTLVAELLRGSGLRCYAAGNIGKPLISFVAASKAEDIYATELSSFQLETIQLLHPAVASILNITPNHLDRYAGLEAYIAAKRRIFTNQDKRDFAVLNADNPTTALMAAEVPSAPVLFSRLVAVEHGTFMRGGRLFYRDEKREQELLSANDIPLRGTHNLENVLAATAIALLAGAAPESMKRIVRDFHGVEHRLEWVADIRGVQYFNDSKATSVDATLKSLEAFPGDIQLILGGRDKAGDFTALRHLVRQKVKHIVLIGEAAGKIRAALEGATEILEARTVPEAVRLCHNLASPGDVVLLAPACASFDMFEDYEHRGRVFKEAVHNLQPDN